MAMKQEYSLAHLTVLGLPPPEMTYVAARAGYDYVSIRPIYMGLPGEPNYALAENKQMLQQTERALASTGVRIHDIELARIFDGVDPKNYLPAMEVSAELGAKAVLSATRRFWFRFSSSISGCLRWGSAFSHGPRRLPRSASI
jgi:sugar phosphate isomerase/epimerase